MTRPIALFRALACAAALAAAVLCAALGAPAALSAPPRPASHAQARGVVVALGWSSLTIRVGGRRMPVVRALTAAANAVAGLLPPGMSVPNDAGVIAELRQAKLIAPGVGHGAGAVTFWDKPGVHIFMSVDGHDFGTSDGGAGNPAQPHGGAGWLNDGAPDTSNPAFRPYHLVAAELRAPTVYGPTLTFQTGGDYDLLDGVVLGDALHVSYTRDRKGMLTAGAVAFADAHTVTATITAIAEDGSSVTVQTSGGQTLTLSAVSPRLLSWVDVGEEVSLTYTSGAGGTSVARAVKPVQ